MQADLPGKPGEQGLPGLQERFHSYCRNCQNTGFWIIWTADTQAQSVSGGQFQCIACGDLTPILTPEFTSIRWNMGKK
jgi:hypothetical protein